MVAKATISTSRLVKVGKYNYLSILLVNIISVIAYQKRKCVMEESKYSDKASYENTRNSKLLYSGFK